MNNYDPIRDIIKLQATAARITRNPPFIAAMSRETANLLRLNSLIRYPEHAMGISVRGTKLRIKRMLKGLPV